MPKSTKIAVITPYHTETDAVLRKCMASVAFQTHPCVHYLVADGTSRRWIDDEIADQRLRHVCLPRNVANYGSTPRGLGALLAVADGADAIAFLDADNRFDHDHLQSCANAADANDLGVVFARRRIVLADGRLTMPDDEPPPQHIDTSCYFILPAAFHLLSHWVHQPPMLAKICDRLFLRVLREHTIASAVLPRETVEYVSNWRVHYAAAGLTPPETAKDSIATDEIVRWWRALGQSRRDYLRTVLMLPMLDF